jgi:hypothetical protein
MQSLARHGPGARHRARWCTDTATRRSPRPPRSPDAAPSCSQGRRRVRPGVPRPRWCAAAELRRCRLPAAALRGGAGAGPPAWRRPDHRAARRRAARAPAMRGAHALTMPHARLCRPPLRPRHPRGCAAEVRGAAAPCRPPPAGSAPRAARSHQLSPAPGHCAPRAVRRQQVVAAADLDPDNASILVCGGGGVALSVTRKLKDMGSWVSNRGGAARRDWPPSCPGAALLAGPQAASRARPPRPCRRRHHRRHRHPHPPAHRCGRCSATTPTARRSRA